MNKYWASIIGVFIILVGTGVFFLWNNNSTIIPTTNEIPQDWKTYKNKELGFKISYPGKWFLYDRETFLRDNGGEEFNLDACGATGGDGMRDGIVLDREDLGNCVDLAYAGPFMNEFALRSSSSLHEDPLKRYNGNPGEKIITIGGVQALKLSTLEESRSLPANDMTTIEFSYNGRSYVIFLRQTDRNGNYDPILDQILSTFHFLN